MPSWILWLSPVVVAPLLAVVWMTWTARPRGPVEAKETVEEYDRFKAAMKTPLPPGPLPRPRKKPTSSRPATAGRPSAPGRPPASTRPKARAR